MNDVPQLHDETLERCLIGAMILDNSLIPETVATVKAEDYFFQPHQLIHSLIVQLYNTDHAVDLNLIYDYVKRYKLQNIDIVHLATCIDVLPPSSEYARNNIVAYRKRILEYSNKRKVREALQNVLTRTANGIDTAQLISTTKQTLDEIERELSGDISPLIVPADEFLTTPIPKREEIIYSIVHTNELVMVWGFRGRGKSYLLLSMAIAIATGTKFLCWDVPFPRTVLFVDGEMAEDELQQRLYDLSGGEKIGNLYLLTSHNFHKKYNRYLNFNTVTDQEIFFRQLEYMERNESKPEVIFLDNISTLTSGGDENLSRDQEPYVDFSKQLRHRGHCGIWAHHAGKNQDQRGASKREDILDLSINLAEPATPSLENASFRLEFTKTRGRRPKPHSLECELITDETGKLTWTYKAIKQFKKADKKTTYLKWIADHEPSFQIDVAKAFGVSTSAVSQQLDALRAKGYLDGLNVTNEGQNFLKKVYEK